MASPFVFGNFLETELLDDISTNATTIHITPTMANRLPIFALNAQEARLVLWDGVSAPEIVGAVANPGTGFLTVVRGKENTSSRPWAAGTQVICSLTAEIINTALQAYFDALVLLNLSFLKLSGGTLIGPLLLAADPTAALGAVTKQYADSVIGDKLALAGGTMLGAINMNNKRLLNIPAAVSDTEPLRVQEYNSQIATYNNIITDRSGANITAGTGAAYTIDTASAFPLFSTIQIVVTAKLHVINEYAATMAIDILPPRPLRVKFGKPIPKGYLQLGIAYTFAYDLTDDCVYVQNMATSKQVAGDLKWSALETDHDSWLLCDGRTVPRTGATAELYANIGTKFGVGDGVTTFNLPLAAGRSLIARNPAAGVTEIAIQTTGAIGGAFNFLQARNQVAPHLHANTVSETPHTHTINQLSGATVMSTAGGATNFAAGAFGAISAASAISLNTATAGVAITNVDSVPAPSQQPMSVLHPSLVGNLFIYAY